MIIGLQSLPQNSQSFTAVKYSFVDHETNDPLPRKTARLTTSHDVSMRKGKGKQRDTGDGFRRVYVHNLSPSQPPPIELLIGIVTRAISSILSLDGGFIMSNSYEEIVIATSVITESSLSKADIIHSSLRIALDKCVSNIAQKLLPPNNTRDGVDWLDSFMKAWTWFEEKVDLLRAVLLEMNQVYLLENHMENIRDLGFNAWKAGLLGKGSILTKLSGGIRAWSTTERQQDGFQESRNLIKSLIRSLLILSEYRDIFLNAHLKATANFYANEAGNLHLTLSPTDFLQHAEARVVEEEARSKDVLPEPSWSAVTSVTESSLWGTPTLLNWIADNALPNLLETRDSAGILRMHRLFGRVSALKLMYKSFRGHTSTYTVALVKTPPGGDDNMVHHLVTLKEFLDDVVQQLGDKEMGYAVVAAFEKAFASRASRPAELIAKSIDFAMRNGQQRTSDEEHLHALRKTLDLYRFTQDKDVFRAFYYRALAKRLLLSRSASSHHEKEIIKLLTNEYDPEFGKGDDMFKDMQLSRDLMHDFHKRHSGRTNASALNVYILQYSCWPIARRKDGGCEIALPGEMQEALTLFQAYYETKHASRTIDWFHSLGTATITARFLTETKELSVSLYQAVVLLLFSAGAKHIDYADIKTRTGLDDLNLKRTLQSLACARKKVLLKNPPGRDVNEGDIFKVNSGFTDPRVKVTIPNIAHEETPEESKATTEHVEEDRKFALDAAIVRIMKARKRLRAEQLLASTIDTVKAHFKPPVSLVKQRIDYLLESEFIRRDDDEMNVYHYVA